MQTHKSYLGDGLYAEFDGFQIELYSSNGMIKLGQVYLDDQVQNSLIKFIEKIHDVEISVKKKENPEGEY